MTQQTIHSQNERPAANQYSLRGMFLLLTVTSVIFALLALLLKSPAHWLGVLIFPLSGIIIIAAIELARTISASPPNKFSSHLAAPKNALRTGYFSDKDSPFALPAAANDSLLRQATARGDYGTIDLTVTPSSDSQDPAT